MSAVPKRKFTEAEYLENERRASVKSEFFNGELFAMAGASIMHNLVKENLIRHLGNQLAGTECQSLSSDQKVKSTQTGIIFYPDVLIVCGKWETIGTDVILNPRVVIEVLSDSTESYDRGTKSRHYRTIPSLQEYVLVAQNEMLIDRYVRQADGHWLLSTVTLPEVNFRLTSVPVSIPLDEIYANVTFKT